MINQYLMLFMIEKIFTFDKTFSKMALIVYAVCIHIPGLLLTWIDFNPSMGM